MAQEEDKVDGMPVDSDANEGVSEDEAKDTAEDKVEDKAANEAEDTTEDAAKDASEDTTEDAGEDTTKDKTEADVAADDAAEDKAEADGAADDATEDETEAGGAADGEDNRAPGWVDPAYNGLLQFTLLAALLGLLLGPIPAIVSVLIGGSVFYPFFVVGPLLMYLFNKLLKGGRDIRSLIVIAVFSLAGAYLTALSCRAALYVTLRSLSVFRIPEFVAMAFGRPDALPPSASAYVYPLIFTALGVILAAELLRAASRGERKEESGELKAEDQEVEDQEVKDQEVEAGEQEA